MRDQSDSEILAALIERTGAEQLEPTAEEVAKIQELEEARERANADRILVREKLVKERREAELLKLARGEIPAT